MENIYDICSICQENIEGTINLMTTECNHKFHSTCYIKYINTSHKSSCPMCRNDCLRQTNGESRTMSFFYRDAWIERARNDVMERERNDAMERERNAWEQSIEERISQTMRSEIDKLKTYDPQKYSLFKKRKY